MFVSRLKKRLYIYHTYSGNVRQERKTDANGAKAPLLVHGLEPLKEDEDQVVTEAADSR